MSQACHCVTIAPSGGCYQTVECGGGVVRRCWRGVAGDGDRGPGGSLVRTQPLVPPHCLRISGVLPCSLALLPGELPPPTNHPAILPHHHIPTYFTYTTLQQILISLIATEHWIFFFHHTKCQKSLKRISIVVQLNCFTKSMIEKVFDTGCQTMIF